MDSRICTSKMEDSEMLEQQLPEASQVNLVDTAVQEEQSSPPIKDQNANETIADTTSTLPTDVNMTDNPPMPDKPDNISSNDANTDPSDAPPAEPLEQKVNGDAIPLRSLAPESGPEKVEKSKSWLLDPEVHKRNVL